MTYKAYLTRCRACGRQTSKSYARQHDGQCKPCTEGVSGAHSPSRPTREERILDCGYDAYAREEGHYDGGDN